MLGVLVQLASALLPKLFEVNFGSHLNHLPPTFCFELLPRCPRPQGIIPGSLGHDEVVGLPEEGTVGEIEEACLVPAAGRFCGITQQHRAEVGVHGFRERLQVSVHQQPETSNES